MPIERGHAGTRRVAAFARALPVVPLELAVTAEPGKPDATSAPAAIASIRRAVADVLAGRAAAVVTNPIAKNVLYAPALPIRATPNIWRGWRRRRPASRSGR